MLYEWGSHVRIALERVKQLTSAIQACDQIVSRLKEYENFQHTLNQQGQLMEKVMGSAETLTTVLRGAEIKNIKELRVQGGKLIDELFPNADKQSEEYRKLIKSMFNNIYDIKDSNTRESGYYLDYINKLLTKVISNQVNSLKEFNSKPESLWSIEIQSTKKVASWFLSSQIEVLEEGDEYCAVSNVLSWEDKDFDDFLHATRTACLNGVKVFRIFNLMNFVDNYANARSKLYGARTVIKNHLLLKEEIDRLRKKSPQTCKGSYKVAFFGKRQFQTLVDKYHPTDPDRVKRTSMGLFKGKNKSILAHAGVDFTSLTVTTSQAKLVRHENIFRQMWEFSEKEWNLELLEELSNPSGISPS